MLIYIILWFVPKGLSKPSKIFTKFCCCIYMAAWSCTVLDKISWHDWKRDLVIYSYILNNILSITKFIAQYFIPSYIVLKCFQSLRSLTSRQPIRVYTADKNFTEWLIVSRFTFALNAVTDNEGHFLHWYLGFVSLLLSKWNCYLDKPENTFYCLFEQ